MVETAKESERISSFLSHVNAMCPEASQFGDILRLLCKYKQQSVVIKDLQVANDSVHTNLDVLQATNEALQIELQAAHQEIRRGDAELRAAQTFLQGLRMEKRKVEEELSDANAQLIELQAIKASDSTKAQELQKAVDDLNRQLKQATEKHIQQLNGAREAIRFREGRIQKQRSKLIKRADEIKALKAANLSLTGHRSKLRKKLTHVWSLLHDSKKRHAAELGQQSISHAEETILLQEHLDVALKKCSELSEILETIEAGNKSLSEDISRTKRQVDDMERAVERSTEQLQAEHQEQIVAYESTVASLQDELKTAQNTASSADAQLQEAWGKAKEFETTIQQLKSECADLEKAKKFLKEECKGLIATKQTALDDYQKVATATIENLTSRLQVIECSHAALSSSSDSLEKALRQKASEYDALKATVTALERQCRVIEAELESERSTSHLCRDELQLHYENYLKLETENEALRLAQRQTPDLAEVIAEKSTLDRILTETIAVKEGLEHEMEVLLGQVTDRNQRIVQLEGQLEERRLDQLRASKHLAQNLVELEQYRTTVGQLEMETEQLCRGKDFELQSLQRDLEQVSRTLEDWRERYHKVEAELTTVTNQMRHLEITYKDQSAVWCEERKSLTEWLQKQEVDLQSLMQSSKPPQVETWLDVGLAPQHTMQVATDDPVSPDLVVQLQAKEGEIGRLRSQLKDQMASIKAEHEAILQAWHNLGTRMYRETFYSHGLNHAST